MCSKRIHNVKKDKSSLQKGSYGVMWFRVLMQLCGSRSQCSLVIPVPLMQYKVPPSLLGPITHVVGYFRG